METTGITNNTAYCYYAPLLRRYARIIIKDEQEAVILANKVLKEQYNTNGLRAGKQLRKLLKDILLLHCHYYLQAKIFDRPPVTVPLPAYTRQKSTAINLLTHPLTDYSCDATSL